jgi:hypothetical protein
MTALELTQTSAEIPDPAARKREFERDGFTVFRRMFSPSEMHHFIAECQAFEGSWREREPNSKGQMQFYSQVFRRSEVIRRFVSQSALIDLLVPIAGGDLWVRWDQAVAKGPDSGVFDWHTDTGYDLLPQVHFEVWIALSENRKDNGSLCVIPGSHKRRRLHPHKRVGSHVVAVGSERYDAPGSGKTFIEADAGDVVLFSSRLLHKTYENTTTKTRWAYVAEVLKLTDFDPTVKPPYFVIARDGKPAGDLVDKLDCARDPRQILKTLPLALRHHVVSPLVRRLRSVSSALSRRAD